MNISPKQRFLDICHFKRPGDMYPFDPFWVEALEEWVKQGAPKEIIGPTLGERMRGNQFIQDYFKFEPWYWITEMSGLRIANKPARPKYGTGLVKEPGVPIYPGFEPRIISEDERTVTTRCNL